MAESKRVYTKPTKIMMLGDFYVGKTSILMKFCDNSSIDVLKNLKPTVGIDFKVKTLAVDGQQMRLQMWDTAGTERFHSIAKNYYHGAQGIVVVFDLTEISTFQHVDNWIKQVLDSAVKPILLLGNKRDQQEARAVGLQLAETYAHDHNLLYWEVSAWTGENIEEAFTEFARVLLSKKMANTSPQGGANRIVVTKSRAEERTPFKLPRCCSSS